MSMEKNRETLADTKAYQRLAALFDDGVFTQIDAFARSKDNYTEAVAAYGKVNGKGVYAFAQNPDITGGAMSKAQAAKINKVYDLALKTGAPVVAIYDSIGGRLDEESDLLAAYGDILKFSSNLSGVVPQISVILGNCCGVQALIAVSADVIILSKQAKLSLETDGSSSAESMAHIMTEDEKEALEKAVDLLALLPENNLESAVEFDYEPAEDIIPKNAAETIKAIADGNSIIELQENDGKALKTVLASVQGQTVGILASAEKILDGKSCSKAARFIRFCDAFAIPVVSLIDSEKFGCLKCAAKLSSAYAEATTAKVTVITGEAFGSVYIAAAGTGASADITMAWETACVSALSPEAAAVIELGDDFGGKLKGSKDPKADRAKIIEEFRKTKLTAENAAANGYINDIITPENTRKSVASALEMLMNKRVSTLPKKHNNIYL